MRASHIRIVLFLLAIGHELEGKGYSLCLPATRGHEDIASLELVRHGCCCCAVLVAHDDVVSAVEWRGYGRDGGPEQIHDEVFAWAGVPVVGGVRGTDLTPAWGTRDLICPRLWSVEGEWCFGAWFLLFVVSCVCECAWE